jgi:hypothetical protein
MQQRPDRSTSHHHHCTHPLWEPQLYLSQHPFSQPASIPARDLLDFLFSRPVASTNNGLVHTGAAALDVQLVALQLDKREASACINR